jgi:hypothetical protein
MKKRILVTIQSTVLMFALYVVHFLLFPNVFPNYFRTSNEATALYWGSFALIGFTGVTKGSTNIMNWIPGNVIYLICMGFYSANGAYNAQLGGHHRLKWLLLTAVIYMMELILFQLLIILFAGVLRKFLQHFRKSESR